MQEFLDVFDCTGRKTGRIIERSEHTSLSAGEYTLAVHIYIVNSRGEWLVQKRSETKEYFPGIWDITGGAVLSGEESIDAALRETKEELGITLQRENLRRIAHLPRGNCLLEFWLARADFNISDCVLQPEEVTAVKWIGTEELLELVRNADYRSSLDEYYGVAERVIRSAEPDFRCPVCRRPLVRDERTLRCPNNHCFDRARQGYVNLLQSQSSGKRHGDDKLMVLSRSQFLDKGYYSPLQAAVTRLLNEKMPVNCTVLDAGCGEGYYTAAVLEKLTEAQKNPTVLGIDISKDALIAAGRRSKALKLAVASSFTLPVDDSSCDAVLDIFAPAAAAEFARVLRADGRLVRVFPLQKHLMQLKAAVYENPYENDTEELALEGFVLSEMHELRFDIDLQSTQDIKNLFTMTPYYYKTSAEDQAKLDALQSLTVSAEFGIAVYQKSGEER